MSLRIVCIAFIVSMWTFGCAFREAENSGQDSSSIEGPSSTAALPSVSPEPSIVPADGRLMEVSLEWDGQKKPVSVGVERWIKRESRAWTIPAPLSLPAKAPETLEITLNFAADSQELKSSNIEVIATTGENLEEKRMGIEEIEVTSAEVGSKVRFKIMNIKNLFLENKEQRVFLTIFFRRQGAADASVKLLVVTPPSKITVVQRQQIFGKDGLPELSGLPRYLKSQAESREMIETVKLRNDSFERIRLRIPFKTRGKLGFKGIRYFSEVVPHANPHATMHEQRQAEEIEEVDQDFYVFPANEKLQTLWPGYSQANLDSVYISPGETVDLGLYAEGGLRGRLSERPIRQPSKVSLSVDAVASCPGDRRPPRIAPPQNNDGGAWYCEAINKGEWNFPYDTVEICRKSIPMMRACIDSGGSPSLCTQAALLDDQMDKNRIPHPNNGIPWPLWMGCRRLDLNGEGKITYIHPGWVWQPVLGEFLNGVRSLPVKVDWGKRSIPMLSRFSTGHEAADGEYRELDLFGTGIQLRD